MDTRTSEAERAFVMGADDPNAVISKAFIVLDAFRGTVAPVGLSELTRRSGLPKSTTYRLLNQLVAVGAVVPIGKGYRIGLRLFELGSLHYPPQMRAALQPFLEDLHIATGLVVVSGVLDGADVVYLEYHGPRRGPRSGSQVGAQVPAHCSACGKILLAGLPAVELDRLIAGPLAALTPNSITDPRELKRELNLVRRDEVAYEREEATPGINGIAVPLRGPKGGVSAAVAVSGPSAAVDFDRLLPALRVTASLTNRAGVAMARKK